MSEERTKIEVDVTGMSQHQSAIMILAAMGLHLQEKHSDRAAQIWKELRTLAAMMNGMTPEWTKVVTRISSGPAEFARFNLETQRDLIMGMDAIDKFKEDWNIEAVAKS